MPITTLDVSTLSMPIAALLASLIGATATITAALIQLRIAWRKELKARESRTPITKKARRGPVTAVFVLMVASAVGGFALAQYLTTGGWKAPSTAETDIGEKLEQLRVTVERLEKATLQVKEVSAGQMRVAVLPGSGAEETAATVVFPPCVVSVDGTEDRACEEREAVRVVLCAEVPSGAAVSRIDRFALDDADPRSWAEVRVEPGQPLVNGRFAGDSTERPGTDDHKLVCQEMHHWNNRGRMAGIVVNYTISGSAPRLIEGKPN